MLPISVVIETRQGVDVGNKREYKKYNKSFFLKKLIKSNSIYGFAWLAALDKHRAQEKKKDKRNIRYFMIIPVGLRGVREGHRPGDE